MAESVEWAGLPATVLLKVFSCLSVKELCIANRVCLQWHAVCGSDTLWANLLLQTYGRTTPCGLAGSCRHCLMQLKTASLWSAGSFTAEVTRMLALPPTAGDTSLNKTCIATSGTELKQLWSAAAAADQAHKQQAAGSQTHIPAGQLQHMLLAGFDEGFSVTAVAAGGGNFLVAVGCDGRVVDTRGMFVEHHLCNAVEQSDAAAGCGRGQSVLPRPDAALCHHQHHNQQQQQQQQRQQQQQQQQVADEELLLQHWAHNHNAAAAGAVQMCNPWRPPNGVMITSVAAGVGHVLAVAADGGLWGWGSNECGQLGLGSCSAWQSSPIDITTAALGGAWKPQGERVAAAACGSTHSVVLLAGGAVCTAGCNSSGQCGRDLALQQCPVFCEPQPAPTDSPAAATTTTTTAASTSSNRGRGGSRTAAARSSQKQQPQQRSGPVTTTYPDTSRSSSSSDPTGLPDITESPSAVMVAPSSLLPPAAAIAAGPSNTLVATRCGRVLVAGACGSGQCGSSWVKGSGISSRSGWSPGGFIDVGPELSWHGLTRPTAEQVQAAGGTLAAALPKVVGVAAGDGTCYALTDGGEVFAWGEGSKGQLGTGGCPKLQCTPAKLPWARHITSISASHPGHFAAAVDRAGKLYTWGAGKWGQLGHGDTSKRTVGRLVKQLRHLKVLQVYCCAESILVLTCQHLPHTQHVGGGSQVSSHQQQQSQNSQQQPCDTPPSPAGSAQQQQASRTPKQRQKRRGNQPAQQQQQHLTSTAAAEHPDVSADMSDMTGVAWEDAEEQGPFYCPAPNTARTGRSSSSRHTPQNEPDQPLPPRNSSSRSRRSATSSACDLGSSSPQDSSSSTNSSSSSSRHPRMDKGFKGLKPLLRRLLAGFMADSRQREMTFPATFSAADRYHVHVAAEEWGLAHASHNQDGDRVIKVWKVSRTRRLPTIEAELRSDCEC